ncbi:MAG: ABC transporter substrate-binding protein [Oscillospiraceae bacterium]|nr:ABC transporter substrate-binding protein [Oscillospiraceae bacterium]
MKKLSKTIALILTIAALFALAACDNSSPATSSTEPDDVTVERIDYDRDGNTITLPDEINKIISIGPSNTEVLVALGYGDKIIATDAYSSNVPGIKEGISDFSMMANDGELIIEMDPDVIFVTGMSRAGGDDPYAVIAQAGICLIYMPSSVSIEGIKEDIRYMAAVLSVEETGEEIIANMEAEIERILEITSAASETKRVYFEIAAAPNMYSFGSGTFLHEMIEMLGGENIFGETISWASVSDEAILDADPEVILTTVNYIDNPIDEIKSRDGWNNVTAIANDAVYYISTDASNRPSHNIVIAMEQIARAIHPELFEG